MQKCRVFKIRFPAHWRASGEQAAELCMGNSQHVRDFTRTALLVPKPLLGKCIFKHYWVRTSCSSKDPFFKVVRLCEIQHVETKFCLKVMYEMSCFYFCRCVVGVWSSSYSLSMLILPSEVQSELSIRRQRTSVISVSPIGGNDVPAWYFKRLHQILLSDYFPQIYRRVKGVRGCLE